jgi:hypothetical protein
MSGGCDMPERKWCSPDSLGLLRIQKGTVEPVGRNSAGNVAGTAAVAAAVAVVAAVVVVVAVAVVVVAVAVAVVGSAPLFVLFVPSSEGVHAVAGSTPLVEREEAVLVAHFHTYSQLHRNNCHSLSYMRLVARFVKRVVDAGVGVVIEFALHLV